MNDNMKKDSAWSGMIGQDVAISRLKRLLGEERLPHALLFFGQDGIGKRRAAEALAVTLLCDGRSASGTEPCGECESCAAMASGNHPDYYVIEPTQPTKNGKVNRKAARLIRIEDIQNLRAELSRVAKLSRRRVVIIDDADMMNEQAANALLKTLEEPTGDVVFILITSRREALLDTIISRCLMMPFAPLTESGVMEILAANEVPEQERAALASLSGGSAGEAIRLYRGDALALRDDAMDVLSRARAMNDEAVLGEGKRLGSMQRDEISEWIKYFRFCLMDVMTLLCGGEHLFSGDRRMELLDIAGAVTESWASRAMAIASDVEKRILKSNANTELQIEAMLLRLAAL